MVKKDGREGAEKSKEEGSMEVSKIKGEIKSRINIWMVLTAVLALILLIMLIRAGIAGSVFGALSREQAGTRVTSLINGYFIQDGSATLDSVSEESGLYKVTLNYNSNKIPVYITKDGKSLILPNGIVSVAEIEATASQQTQGKLEVSTDDDAVKGSGNAAVTIVEFSDYECPFCGKHFRETLPQIISEYVDTGKVRLVFRDFPLEFHKNAQKSAEAAECAGEQGRYWEMHDKLFQNQNALDIASLKKHAQDLALNTAKFDECLDSGKMASEIQNDIADGQNYGVSGTPAFFINGIKLVGALPFSEFKRIIDAELNK